MGRKLFAYGLLCLLVLGAATTASAKPKQLKPIGVADGCWIGQQAFKKLQRKEAQIELAACARLDQFRVVTEIRNPKVSPGCGSMITVTRTDGGFRSREQSVCRFRDSKVPKSDRVVISLEGGCRAARAELDRLALKRRTDTFEPFGCGHVNNKQIVLGYYQRSRSARCDNTILVTGTTSGYDVIEGGDFECVGARR